MSYAGKIIGALIGLLMFRNGWGALLGAAIGHCIDAGWFAGPRPRGSREGIVEPLFAFAGALSKSDGRVSEREIAVAEALMARLQLTPDLRRLAIDRFDAGKQPGFPVHLAVAGLKQWCGGRRDLAYTLLDPLLDLVYAEGEPQAPKLALMHQLCWALGVHERELAAIAAMKGYRDAAGARRPGAGPRAQRAEPAETATDPYLVLGIARDAVEREIKQAYRKLMSQHHPDKLGDVPDTLKRRAEERAREINRAYERIRVQRGFR